MRKLVKKDQISTHFKRSEFACSCGCGFEAVDKELVEILEEVRAEFGPVNISSACRCLKKNREIGSKDTSQHVKAMACDIWIKGVTPDRIVYWVNDHLLYHTGGLGIYNDFCHIDIRRTRARWDNRTKNA